jgi:glycine betaine transporter
MFKNPVLIIALTITGVIAAWGILDTEGLAQFATLIVNQLFESRGWFIMLTVSAMLFVCIGLAISPYGRIKLGKDDEEPEFSTISWLTMLFAAGMGVGLLYWGSAEPVSHFMLARKHFDPAEAARTSLFVTNFHWGIHAWTIYAVVALVIAYFSFRRQTPTLISAPIKYVFGDTHWTRIVGVISDVCAIVAISIGVAGSIAMGIFQVQGGIVHLFTIKDAGTTFALGIFAVLFIAYMLPLMVDLGKGMAVISNTNMLIASSLMVFVLLSGPTHYLMSAIVETLGHYASNVLSHGFRTFTFAEWEGREWFKTWSLTYMVWWLAWAPFVGVFIARISRGRTIREFVTMVLIVPTLFSIMWFGVFGGIAFFEVMRENATILEVVKNNVDSTVFHVLGMLPLAGATTAATILVAFLFIVTSVVSAGYVLGIFSTGGNLNPSIRVKLIWGVILGALGIVMILSGSLAAVRAITAVGAMPFVFIVLILMVCLLKALKKEAG